MVFCFLVTQHASLFLKINFNLHTQQPLVGPGLGVPASGHTPCRKFLDSFVATTSDVFRGEIKGNVFRNNLTETSTEKGFQVPYAWKDNLAKFLLLES